jgi:hypothetical protein
MPRACLGFAREAHRLLIGRFSGNRVFLPSPPSPAAPPPGPCPARRATCRRPANRPRRHFVSSASSSRSTLVNSLARSSPLSSSSSFTSPGCAALPAAPRLAPPSVRDPRAHPTAVQRPEPPPQSWPSRWRLEAVSTHSYQHLIPRFRAFIHNSLRQLPAAAQQLVVLVEAETGVCEPVE